MKGNNIEEVLEKVVDKEEKCPDVSTYNANGGFHPTRVVKIGKSAWGNDIRITVSGLITGCGAAQVAGMSYLPDDITKEKFLEDISFLKIEGAGCVICTLGADYYNREPKVLEIGFELMAEYSNYRHGADGKYKQRMYMLKL